jgi:hypothetical protein
VSWRVAGPCRAIPAHPTDRRAGGRGVVVSPRFLAFRERWRSPQGDLATAGFGADAANVGAHERGCAVYKVVCGDGFRVLPRR